MPCASPLAHPGNQRHPTQSPNPAEHADKIYRVSLRYPPRAALDRASTRAGSAEPESPVSDIAPRTPIDFPAFPRPRRIECIRHAPSENWFPPGDPGGYPRTGDPMEPVACVDLGEAGEDSTCCLAGPRFGTRTGAREKGPIGELRSFLVPSSPSRVLGNSPPVRCTLPRPGSHPVCELAQACAIQASDHFAFTA